MPAEKNSRGGMDFNPFSKNQFGSFASQFACDTIYSIDGDIASPSFILDFGKLSLPEDKRDAISIRKMMQKNDSFLCFRHGWKQVGQIISFGYCSDERWDNMLFYDKKSELFYGGKWNYPDLELGRIYAPPGYTDDSFVFLVQSLSIIEDAENYPNKRSKEYLDLASSLDIEDNPVIVFWKVVE